MPVFRFRRPPRSKNERKATGTSRTTKESNSRMGSSEIKCKTCGPEICYDAVTSGSRRRCLECRKRHIRCVREDTVATNKKLHKVSSKIPRKPKPKPKPKGRGRVLQMEAVVITSLLPGRKKAQQRQEVRGPKEEEEEEQLELSSIKQDLEMVFKQSERKIRMMKEQVEEAEKLQNMNVEFLNKFGRDQFWPTSDSASSSTACSSSRMETKLSREEDKSRLAATGSAADGLPDLLLILREVIDEALTRKAQGASQKIMVKDEEIIDLT